MDPYLHFENPSPTFPVVYQGLADYVSLVLAYVFPQGFFALASAENAQLFVKALLGCPWFFLGDSGKKGYN